MARQVEKMEQYMKARLRLLGPLQPIPFFHPRPTYNDRHEQPDAIRNAAVQIALADAGFAARAESLVLAVDDIREPPPATQVFTRLHTLRCHRFHPCVFLGVEDHAHIRVPNLRRLIYDEGVNPLDPQSHSQPHFDPHILPVQILAQLEALSVIPMKPAQSGFHHIFQSAPNLREAEFSLTGRLTVPDTRLDLVHPQLTSLALNDPLGTLGIVIDMPNLESLKLWITQSLLLVGDTGRKLKHLSLRWPTATVETIIGVLRVCPELERFTSKRWPDTLLEELERVMHEDDTFCPKLRYVDPSGNGDPPEARVPKHVYCWKFPELSERADRLADRGR